MERRQVTADKLTALLALNRCYEAKPLPFRMQPNVEFIISEQEYVTYCENLSQETFLSAPVQEIVETISKYRATGRRQDYYEQARYFAVDVAIGQLKELMYSIDACKGATIITAKFCRPEDTISINNLPSSSWISSLADKIRIIDSLFLSRGYNTTVADMLERSNDCNREIRAHNVLLLKRAVYQVNFAELRLPFDLIL